MPNAAHNRSDRTWTGNGRSEYSRIDRRSLSVWIRGLPPSVRGGGSSNTVEPVVPRLGAAASMALLAKPALTIRRVIMEASSSALHEWPPV